MLKKIGLVVAALVVGAILVFSLRGSTSSKEYALGEMYPALNVDANGCPADVTSQFYSNETIYVSLGESDIPRGTSIFARLYYQNDAIEDTDEVVAEQDMESCMWFEFTPDVSSGGFPPGQYTAELYVNGAQASSVAFEVADAAGNAPESLPQTGRIALGRFFTSTSVDQAGCPVDSVSEFYSNEFIYVSMEESYIPAGTEVFSRLLYEGQPVEDTDPIYAENDIQACAWFVFEPAGGNWQPGTYEVEVYVNGTLAERLPVEIQ